MKKVIVTTTINPITKAIRKFQAFDEWELIVVGDKKTPLPYVLDRGTYLSCQMQEEFDKELSAAIGWNCIQRRNFGLLWAHKMGADIIATVDDDNIPYDNWGDNLLLDKEVKVNYYETDLPAFDPIGATNIKHIWHRGYPLELIPERDYSKVSVKIVHPDIQVDFWNGEPDIDAVCRMEHRPSCAFNEENFPFSSNAFSPFNSQNTFITKDVLSHYFLFPHVGRMDDIWAAYYVEALGFKAVYQKPSVYQDRNLHDLIKDMKAEYIGYENNLALIKDLRKDPGNIFKYLPKQSIKAFELYKKHY